MCEYAGRGLNGYFCVAGDPENREYYGTKEEVKCDPDVSKCRALISAELAVRTNAGVMHSPGRGKRSTVFGVASSDHHNKHRK